MGVYLAVQLRELRWRHGAGRDAEACAQRQQHPLLPAVMLADQRQGARHIRHLHVNIVMHIGTGKTC